MLSTSTSAGPHTSANQRKIRMNCEGFTPHRCPICCHADRGRRSPSLLHIVLRAFLPVTVAVKVLDNIAHRANDTRLSRCGASITKFKRRAVAHRLIKNHASVGFGSRGSECGEHPSEPSAHQCGTELKNKVQIISNSSAPRGFD